MATPAQIGNPIGETIERELFTDGITADGRPVPANLIPVLWTNTKKILLEGNETIPVQFGHNDPDEALKGFLQDVELKKNSSGKYSLFGKFMLFKDYYDQYSNGELPNLSIRIGDGVITKSGEQIGQYIQHVALLGKTAPAIPWLDYERYEDFVKKYNDFVQHIGNGYKGITTAFNGMINTFNNFLNKSNKKEEEMEKENVEKPTSAAPKEQDFAAQFAGMADFCNAIKTYASQIISACDQMGGGQAPNTGQPQMAMQPQPIPKPPMQSPMMKPAGGGYGMGMYENQSDNAETAQLKKEVESLKDFNNQLIQKSFEDEFQRLHNEGKVGASQKENWLKMANTMGIEFARNMVKENSLPKPPTGNDFESTRNPKLPDSNIDLEFAAQLKDKGYLSDDLFNRMTGKGA